MSRLAASTPKPQDTARREFCPCYRLTDFSANALIYQCHTPESAQVGLVLAHGRNRCPALRFKGLTSSTAGGMRRRRNPEHDTRAKTLFRFAGLGVFATIRSARCLLAAASLDDFGEDARIMLPRLLVSDQRGPALTPCMHRLLAGNGRPPRKPRTALCMR